MTTSNTSDRALYDQYAAIGRNRRETESGEALEKAFFGGPPDFARDKVGRIKATLQNLELALDYAEAIGGYELAFDRFNDELMVHKNGGNWRRIADTDLVEMRTHLERFEFLPVPRELMRDAVSAHAARHQFDSAQDWISSIEWDGKSRVAGFMHLYCGAPDCPYSTAVSLYTWTALAGRLIDPGCKADMVPIWLGAQGARKSTGVRNMAPDFDLYCEINLALPDDTIARLLRGKSVGELSELKGLRGRDLEHIKSFLARPRESWVPKFKEHAIEFDRRCVFIGTTNAETFLEDETGNRRFLPIRVGPVDSDAIARDKWQLWAEARDLYNLAGGVQWGDAERLARKEHDRYVVEDSWIEGVESWIAARAATLVELEKKVADGVKLDDFKQSELAALRRGGFTTFEVLSAAINIPRHQITKLHENRITKIVKRLGYSQNRVRVEGERVRMWELTK